MRVASWPKTQHNHSDDGRQEQSIGPETASPT